MSIQAGNFGDLSVAQMVWKTMPSVIFQWPNRNMCALVQKTDVVCA